MKQYVVTFDGGYQYEESSDYILADEKNLEGIIDAIKHGFEIDEPHNIHIYEISKEVTNEYNVKTKYDQEDNDPV